MVRIGLAAFWLAASHPALGAERCRIADPTGTPLNVRTAPQGRVIGTLPNGFLASILEQSTDRFGKSWVYVADYGSGRPIGWIYRQFCHSARDLALPE